MHQFARDALAAIEKPLFAGSNCPWQHSLAAIARLTQSCIGVTDPGQEGARNFFGRRQFYGSSHRDSSRAPSTHAVAASFPRPIA
jgi:hypothetical protein